MIDNMIELGKRAVWCRGWRWMPGMLAWRPDCPSVRLAAIEDAGNALQEHRWLPDLTDPATLGCLLALVRFAYSDPWFYVRPSDTYRPDGVYGWECFGYLPGRDGGSWRGSGYASEVEALVAALEAAP